jgi:hypothetical protein
MRFVARPLGSEPACLAKPSKKIRAERRAAAKYYYKKDCSAEDFKAYSFTAYRDRTVGEALALLFRNKCAYCERDIRGGGESEIEHFRPKGGVEDEVHPGYWWLAHSWLNMLPSCPGCNQRRFVNILDNAVTPEEFERLCNAPKMQSHGKQNYFPIAGVRAMHRKDDLEAEDPLLIDPTVRDPARHLSWDHGGAQVIVRARIVGGLPDPYGQASIKGYALNRVDLIKQRNTTLKTLRLQRTLVMDELGRTATDDPNWHAALERAVRNVRYVRENHDDGDPFTAMTNAFLADWEAELTAMGHAADG